jgi:hypothetical protein
MGPCKRGNELLGAINGSEFLEQLHDEWLLKKDGGRYS